MYRIITVSIVLGFLIVGIVASFMMGIMGFALPTGVLLSAMLLGKPRVLLAVYWIWALTFTMATYFINSRMLLWLDEWLFVLILGTLVGHAVLQRRGIPATRIMKNSVFLLLVLTAVSAYFNRVPHYNTFRFVLQYFRFPIVFYFTLLYMRGQSKAIFKYIVGTFVFQVAFNFAWILHINPVPNFRLLRGNIADSSMGTYLGAHIIAYYMIAFISLLLACHDNVSDPRKRKWILLVICIALLQLFLTYTLHAYLLLLPIIGMQLLLFSSARNRVLWIALSLLLGMTVIRYALFTYGQTSGGNVGRYLTASHLKDRWDGMLKGSKGQIYKDTLYYSMKEMKWPLLGAGPGSFGSSIGLSTKRPFTMKYIAYFYDTHEGEKLYATTITHYPFVGFLTIWGELGPIGCLLYWGLHIYAVWRVFGMVKCNKYAYFHQKVLATGFISTMSLYLIVNLLYDYAYNPFMSSGIWIWAASVWIPYEKEDLEEEEKITPSPQASTLM